MVTFIKLLNFFKNLTSIFRTIFFFKYLDFLSVNGSSLDWTINKTFKTAHQIHAPEWTLQSRSRCEFRFLTYNPNVAVISNAARALQYGPYMCRCYATIHVLSDGPLCRQCCAPFEFWLYRCVVRIKPSTQITNGINLQTVFVRSTCFFAVRLFVNKYISNRHHRNTITFCIRPKLYPRVQWQWFSAL